MDDLRRADEATVAAFMAAIRAPNPKLKPNPASPR
jgi:hypothetical protein